MGDDKGKKQTKIEGREEGKNRGRKGIEKASQSYRRTDRCKGPRYTKQYPQPGPREEVSYIDWYRRGTVLIDYYRRQRRTNL